MTKQEELIFEIRDSVSGIAAQEKISVERAFAAWYAHNFLGVQIEDAIEASSFDGGEDQSIDFIYTDNVNERVIIFQAHFPENTTRATPKSKWDGIITGISCVERPKTFRDAGRIELASAAEEASEKLHTYDVSVGVISFGEKSDQIERSKIALEQGDRYKGFQFVYESRDDIIDKYTSLKESDKGIAEDYLQLDSDKYLKDQGGYGQAWVGSVRAEELARLYEKYHENLFAKNVRLFLGSRKGGINEKIIETAQNTPGKFWALNNGITILADTVTPNDNGRFKLTRFSIVNGCQTTVCLVKANAPKGAKVLARIVAANETVVGEIVRYNNTQNAIKIWTVRAADSLQDRLRIAFQEVSIDYAPRPEDSKTKKSIDIIYLDKLAQYIASGSQETIVAAVKEKSELFDRYYQDIFPNSIRPEDVYLMWLLGNFSDQERLKRLGSLNAQGDADKVQSNLLGVSGTYWTIYCSYKFINDLNKQPLNITMDKLKAEEMQNALKKYVETGLDTYLDISIDTYEQEEYRSVRSALRSPRFLQKFTQKLANKTARLKEKNTLPSLYGALKSIKKQK